MPSSRGSSTGGHATAKHVRQERLPDKQVYRITKRGEDAFLAWLEEPVDYFSRAAPSCSRSSSEGR